jgi:hypothetical protein
MVLRSSTRRRGISLVLVVVSLVSIMGVLALSLEGGMLLTERRNAQATADAASFAAASDLYYNWFSNQGVDVAGTARAAAFRTAGYNGYMNDGTQTVVTVNIPPLSGDYVGKPGYAEVIVEYYHTRAFSSIFGTDRVPVRARAVSVGMPKAGEFGILVLDPTIKSAYNVGGGAIVEVTNVPIVVDSNNAEAATANGGAGSIADQMYIVGAYSTAGGGYFTGPITTGAQPMEDPLKYLPPPDKNSLTKQSNKKVQYTQGTTILYPGVYRGGISASSTASLTLMPGIYYMDTGGFSFSGYGNLIGHGVMIYNDPGNGNADGVSISANATVDLSPMTTGIYAGITFFQDRTADVDCNISGGSGFHVDGTFYFANARINLTGTGGFVNMGSQYVCRMLNCQGGATIHIDWNPDKVAKVRFITIVE